MRKGQTPHKSLYSSTLAPMQLFLKLLDTPIGSSTRDREIGIAKFLIFLSQRLFYFTCSGKFCGGKSDGLQPYEFVRFLFGPLETQAKKAVLDTPATPSPAYADIDEWIRLCKKMAEWNAFVIQEAWSQEFVLVIEFLACQFSSALVEGSDITLKHIDEVLGTVMQKHRAEHDFFINDPGLYKSQYPDGVITTRTLGDVRRPKLWIVDANGTERGWFRIHFRKLKQFREREKMNRAFATLEELKANRLKIPEKPGGTPV